MVRTLAKAWLVPHQPHSTPVTHFHTAVTHILRYLTVISDTTLKWGESYFPGEADESLIYFFLFFWVLVKVGERELSPPLLADYGIVLSRDLLSVYVSFFF